MAVTVNATNYNGELDLYLYKVLGLGMQTAEKGAIYVKSGVNYKDQLDWLEADEDPFTDYTDDTPSTGESAVTKYKRELNPLKFTVWGSITPSSWLPVWRKYRAQGTLTQLSANPSFMRDVFDLVANSAQRQLDKLIWQGDTTAGASSPLRFMDGLHKKIEADSDSNVVFVTPQGTITQTNVVDILEAVYSAMEDKFFDDPDYKFHMNTGDFKLLQFYNNDAKKTTVGVLDENIKRLFLEKRIEHFTHVKASHIVAAKTMSAENSNFILGMYATLMDEIMGMKIEKKDLSNITRYRFDAMGDVNYRYGGDIVYYKPV